MRTALAPIVMAAAIVSACATGPIATPSPTLRPTGQPTAAPTPSPAQTPTRTSRPTRRPTAEPSNPPVATPAVGVIATFEVVGETFRILLTDPADIEIAELLLSGEPAPTIPNGRIVRGETGVNVGYTWSIDPESIEFADVTIEVCDGLPSHVEEGILTSDRFCPWSAELIALDPA